MAFGVTPEGFRSKTLEEIRAELEAELRELFGDEINLSSSSRWGQFVGIFSSKVRELWELAASVYASADPDRASDAALEAVAALTGTVRRAASRSVVTASVTVEPGTYAAGSLVANVQGRPAIRFRNRDEVVNATGGALVVSAVFEAESTGPVEASAGTLTAIATPVSGWSAITNAADAVEGRNAETDEELRRRRLEELTLSPGSALDAIRVALLRLEGEGEDEEARVVSVTMFENDTDTVDGLGLPPHSFEALVHDGTQDGSAVSDAVIGAAIWEVKPGGIRAHGTTAVTVQDSQGTDRVVRFSRPETIAAYLEIDLETDEELGWDPDASPQLVAEAVAEWGDVNIRVGNPLRLSALNVPIFTVAGVVDVLEIRAGFTASPVGTTNLTAGARDLIDLDTSRVAVSVP
jgi:hypothetical protein